MAIPRAFSFTDEANAALEAAFAACDRLEDIWTEGYSWRFCRAPEEGHQLPSGHYLMKFPSVPADLAGVHIPSVTILYRFDNSETPIEVLHIGFDI